MQIQKLLNLTGSVGSESTGQDNLAVLETKLVCEFYFEKRL
jgi:hypothetical protein